jgi:hypothetical protein
MMVRYLGSDLAPVPPQPLAMSPAEKLEEDGSMNSNGIGRKVHWLAVTGMLATTMLGGGVAFANPCRGDCRQDRSACVKACTEMAGCQNFYQTCRQGCVESTFGDDRHDCIDGCKSDRKECREWANSCRADCKIESLDCKAVCVSLGF